MTFGWEGFSFDHPEDWAPVSISGDRNQGYARLASPGRLVLQTRWRRLKTPADADRFLDSYLGKLARDSRRSGVPFKGERTREEDRTHYLYTGHIYGRGALFSPEGDGRAFVIEVASSRNDSMQGVVRDALRSFRIGGARDRWSAFGLDLSLPSGLAVQRREFLAGKTRLEWSAKSARIYAERWGFAEQLLLRHGLEEWSRAVVGSDPVAESAEVSGRRLKLKGRRGSFCEAIVAHQPERNQLVVVRVESKDQAWRPEWDWLT